MASIHVAHRDLPARSLPILLDSGGGNPARRCDYLYQCVFHLLICRIESRLFRRTPRSGESVALRIRLQPRLCEPSSPLTAHRAVATMGKENFQRIMRIVVAFCPFALARAGHVQNMDLVRAD